MKEIYDLAEQYHNDGNNCVESVVKACNDGLKLGLPDVAIRMVSGMGGGIGRSGCVCGALSGSCLVISSSVGRLDPSESIRQRSINIHMSFMSALPNISVLPAAEH